MGSFAANAWGVHDIHGNVWEWVEDCYNDSYEGAPTDGSAWTSEDCGRVGRGGSALSVLSYLRSARRLSLTTGSRYRDLGFRVARSF